MLTKSIFLKSFPKKISEKRLKKLLYLMLRQNNQLFQSMSRKYIDNYDYILFVLDYVKIIHLDINDMIKIKNEYNIQMLSPKILNASHEYMFNYDELTINNFLEIFLLLMTPIDMKKYLSIIFWNL